ncbi:MAG: N-acetylmuramoyl-L-alanine amidase [Lachnospiraceae bacterium]|nr:N-acetylmuramoyl-L-alanine amidase [Lachnospiraceae bacterium]
MRNHQRAFIEKIMQYGMLAVLLLGAFFLPRFSARQDASDDPALTPVSAQDQTSRTSNSGDSGKGTIVLDPGHGGDDPGMTGSSGITEKVLNLVYAKKLAGLFTDAGYRVVLTRETEDGLYDADSSHKKAQDMQRRVAIIAKEQPILTLSIHQNSYQDPAICGPQVFFYEHSADGEALAKCIQDSLNTELSIARPRVHKGNGSYYILKRSEGTTVIVECGFLSNPQEEEKLQQDMYQDQVVQAVFDGTMAYLANTDANRAG